MPTKYYRPAKKQEPTREVKEQWYCRTCEKWFDSYWESMVQHECDAPAIIPCEVEEVVTP